VIIIPAIDIKDGKCVRLYKGDFEKSKIYSEDPVRIAKEFEEMGASLIHVVDLDGAKRGELANFNTVEKILGSISIDIELGGGIRSMEAIEKIIRAGIKRVILGSRIIEDVSFLDDCSEFIDNIIISADLNREYLSTHGWLKRTDIHYSDFLKDVLEHGIKEVIVTDIDKDGTLEGPNVELYQKIADEFKALQIIVSGGISSLDDIKSIMGLQKENIKGIITGKAIYEKKIDLKEVFSYVS